MHAISRCQFQPIAQTLIKAYRKYYKISLDDCEKQHFTSLDDFFTRALKPQRHTFEQQPNLLRSPAEGKLTDHGIIKKSHLIQAKKYQYSLEQFIQMSPSRWEEGYFYSIYLAPHNYHRIHMPIKGQLKRSCYVPGTLFSVNQKHLLKIPQLFTRNERYIMEFETDIGPLILVMIGALLVRGIETAWSNTQLIHQMQKPKTWEDHNQTIFKQGQWLANFHMGSSLCLILPPNSLGNSLAEAGNIGLHHPLAKIKLAVKKGSNT